jgi:hypothetical protein
MAAKVSVEKDLDYFPVSVQCTCLHQMTVYVGLTLLPDSARSIKCPACGVEVCPLVHGPIIAGPFEEARGASR